MGRITGVIGGAGIGVERPPINVEIYDPWLERTVTTAYPLYPLTLTRSPGPTGGEAEFVHAAEAFSTRQQDDADKLIGCYVKVKIRKRVIWAGVITKQRLSHHADQDSGENLITFTAHDLWNAVADQSLYQSFLGCGGTASNILYWLQKKNPYTEQQSGESSVSQSVYLPNKPKLPYNKKGELILDIDVGSFNLTNSVAFPRTYGNAGVGELICALGEELHHEMVVIKPSASKEKLGTITAVTLATSPRVIAFGGPSDAEYEKPVYFPLATSITGDMDYSGATTDIRMVGGDITESLAVKLTPAWDSTLTNDVLATPALLETQPHKYGMVGKAFYADVGALYQMLPFCDVCKTRSIGDAIASSPSNNTDSCRIWEYHGNLTDSDELKDTDSNWSETGSDHVFLHYDPNTTVSRQIRKFFYGTNFDWTSKNSALVVFAEPQLLIGLKRGEEGLISDPDNAGVKILVVEAMRKTGVLSYYTGHRGKYPRPRYRYYPEPRWVKHLATHHEDVSTAVYFHGRYILNDVGRSNEATGVNIDYTIPMFKEAERMVKRTARSINTIQIAISGIDESWNEGDWIGTVVALNGNVIRDNLDWYVKTIRYDTEHAETFLTMGGLRNA